MSFALTKDCAPPRAGPAFAPIRPTALAGDTPDLRILTLSPYGTRNPMSGGTNRIHFLNRGYAKAGWQVLQISGSSFGRGIRQTIRSALLPLLGERRSEIVPGYREENYFNPFVVLGNRRLRLRGAAQVAASILPPLLRPTPRMKREIARHPVILFEHPHLFDMAAPFLRPDHIVMLDAHNIESALCPVNKGDEPLVIRAARALRDVEHRAIARADLVFVCSDTDRATAIDQFGADPAKVIVAPNGVDTASVRPVDGAGRDAAKRQLGLSGPTAIFVGSRWGPNIDAARWVARAAETMPGVTWLIVGAVGDSIACPVPSNCIVTGLVDRVGDWYAASDLAINPMESGSGSNIKMFEYLAAGLPVVTTPFGARGVDDDSGLAVIPAELDAIPSAVLELVADARLGERRAAARALAERAYDWTHIAGHISDKLRAALAAR